MYVIVSTGNAMQDEATDLDRVQKALGEVELECKELAVRVIEGNATIAELAEAEDHLIRLQALAAAVQETTLHH
jgi:hypothetical protein